MMELPTSGPGFSRMRIFICMQSMRMTEVLFGRTIKSARSRPRVTIWLHRDIGWPTKVQSLCLPVELYRQPLTVKLANYNTNAHSAGATQQVALLVARGRYWSMGKSFRSVLITFSRSTKKTATSATAGLMATNLLSLVTRLTQLMATKLFG